MPKSIDQIIDEQVRRWSTTTPRRPRREAHWPLITISREYGARGAALAAALAERTGFNVWDRELVHAIAEHTGGDAALLTTLDEHRRSMIEDAIGGMVLGRAHSNLPYLRALARIVRTIAAHGGALIVGRGANYIVRPQDALRVRVVCPLDDRVAGLARRLDLDADAARRRLVRMDAERADFVRYHFRRDVTDAADYDLVVNAGTFPLDALADLVLAAYEARVGRRPEPAVAAHPAAP